jgi:hypothetical protein
LIASSQSFEAWKKFKTEEVSPSSCELEVAKNCNCSIAKCYCRTAFILKVAELGLRNRFPSSYGISIADINTVKVALAYL